MVNTKKKPKSEDVKKAVKKTPKKGSKEPEERSRNAEVKKEKKREKEEVSKAPPVEKKEKKKEKEEKSRIPDEKDKKKGAQSSPTLLNKRKFCKKFYNDELEAKKLMRAFVGLRTPNNCLAEAMKKHPDKCRYSDILCPDVTRVVLAGRPPENDFIHANWMTMPDGFRYISAQGPMEETTEDFWHMVFTEKSPAIVMICDWVEDGIQKCTRYIPFDDCESRVFGAWTVNRIGDSSMPFEDVRLQLFEIFDKDKPDTRHTVKHLHYLNWPDHSAPLSSTSVVKMIAMLRDPSVSGPPVIHCSAGIGRTATFIGVDYGSQRIGQTGWVEMLDLVREMRLMRDKAVQSHRQFMFMVICITDLMVSQGVVRNENMDDLVESYKEFMAARKKRAAEKKEKEKKPETKPVEPAKKEEPQPKKSELKPVEAAKNEEPQPKKSELKPVKEEGKSKIEEPPKKSQID
ncbi:unnamed protein product [Caenorhabditis sp. 36 PRJEB53466]|nr:unnamed protein product [Caenorhabditis sp. 36 PRJEB53466]